MNGRHLVSGLLCLLAGAVFVGCASEYGWRSTVPSKYRTICVPTFANESDVSEAGAVATRQLLREIQREGTFRIRSREEAVLEVQGVIKSVSVSNIAYDRHGGEVSACDVSGVVEVSVIDRSSHKVLVNGRVYAPSATYSLGQDSTTALRDATGRLMDDLSRMVVDDLLSIR